MTERFVAGATGGAATPVPGRPERRPPGPITAAWLERAALHYLERYSASAEMLRRTLARRVDKRARARGEEASAFAETVEATVARAVGAGLVDDARFTAARLATLRRRGTSRRAAAAKLASKGVSRALVEAAMDAEAEAAPEADPAASEEAAARAYAKRRRLGPHRRPGTADQNRDRDIAAMARAGFAYGLARRVIEDSGDQDSGNQDLGDQDLGDQDSGD